MKEIKEVNIDGEVVYLKKSFLGWSAVKPIKINGKINWKNLIAGGSWWNLLIIGFIVVVVLGSVFEYSTTLKVANECLNASKIINVSLIP